MSQGDWTDDPLLRHAFKDISTDHYVEVHEPGRAASAPRVHAVIIAAGTSTKDHCHDSLLDYYAACVIFWSHLANFDSFLVFAVSIAAPL
ncbi:hypothetical protein ACHHYP_12238, partial [Achlya hypogyna]